MKAAWPSPHDRKDYKEQLDQLRLPGGPAKLRDVERHQHLHVQTTL